MCLENCIDQVKKVMSGNKTKIEAEKFQISNLSRFEKAMANGSTPILNELNLRLFVAVMMGTKDEVSKVIEEGADVNALNLNQVCPLELAKAYKRKAVVKILEAHGAHGAHVHQSPDSKIKPVKKH